MEKMVVDVLNKPIIQWTSPITQKLFIYLWTSRRPKWKNRQIDCFELNQLIHAFHQKKSRELWKIYDLGDNDIIVVRALRLGVLQRGEISAETAEAIHLDRDIDGYRE